MDDTGLPKWLNAGNKALSLLSLSGPLSLLLRPSVSDSSLPSVVATKLAWSTFPQVTQLLL